MVLNHLIHIYSYTSPKWKISVYFIFIYNLKPYSTEIRFKVPAHTTDDNLKPYSTEIRLKFQLTLLMTILNLTLLKLG